MMRDLGSMGLAARQAYVNGYADARLFYEEAMRVNLGALLAMIPPPALVVDRADLTAEQFDGIQLRQMDDRVWATMVDRGVAALNGHRDIVETVLKAAIGTKEKAPE
jgi:hypothetical protein